VHFGAAMSEEPTPSMREQGEPIAERRRFDRVRRHRAMELVFRGLRAAIGRAHDLRAGLGIFLLLGAVLSGIAIWGFAKLAGEVREGDTQAFDEAMLHLIDEHRVAWVERSLLEITALGTGLVVMMVVGTAAMFLWLTRHRYSSMLLLVATAGGLLLNNILKYTFKRPRPQVFEWVDSPVTSSFPSGHAMSAAIVYVTVAYLAARLMKRRVFRLLTMLAAFLLIALIGLSRMYLGVHYPSDVLGGYVIGIGWAAFCMATLEAIQAYGRRNAPREMARYERPPESKVDAAAEAGAMDAAAAVALEAEGKGIDPAVLAADRRKERDDQQKADAKRAVAEERAVGD
jgi:undecaprenyl-diphosphatase